MEVMEPSPPEYLLLEGCEIHSAQTHVDNVSLRQPPPALEFCLTLSSSPIYAEKPHCSVCSNSIPESVNHPPAKHVATAVKPLDSSHDQAHPHPSACAFAVQYMYPLSSSPHANFFKPLSRCALTTIPDTHHHALAIHLPPPSHPPLRQLHNVQCTHAPSKFALGMPLSKTYTLPASYGTTPPPISQ